MNTDDLEILNLQSAVKKLIEFCGDDPEREGIVETPKRFLNSLYYLTKGYRESLDDIVNDAVFEAENDNMVLVKDIELYSLCQHHLLPFIGTCHVAYLPNGKFIGLSKIARIVEFYSRRFQLQEQLTNQIATTLMKVTSALGVAVVIEARHLCMTMRGVQKQNSAMVTSIFHGLFKSDDKIRQEFLSLIKR